MDGRNVLSRYITRQTPINGDVASMLKPNTFNDATTVAYNARVVFRRAYIVERKIFTCDVTASVGVCPGTVEVAPIKTGGQHRVRRDNTR